MKNFSRIKSSFLVILSLYILNQQTTNAFSITSTSSPLSIPTPRSPRTSTSLSMSTTTAPPREKERVDQNTSTRRRSDENHDENSIKRYNDAPMEYLEDEWSTRNPDDPFHILLLDTTFTQNEKVTASYVSGCLSYVLGMPEVEALELTKMAVHNGLSCLGTWEREECLSLGRKLQVRDLVVRVVPFCEGGARGWQAKDASGAAGSNAGDAYSSGWE